MKKWIALVTCIACTLTSFTYADAAPAVEEHLAIPPELAEVIDDTATPPETPVRKQVGEAANDGSKTGSGAGKYVLAASAIIVAIAALILVARHSGHHKKR